jgi:glycosyltransferase involved in cell wall biosynthesis
MSEVVPQSHLRIAVLNRIFKSTGGGAERYSIALVEQLAERHEIHVFAQQIDHQFPGVTYHRVSQPLMRPRWLNQLWFALESWRLTRRGFDVVHSHENTWHGNVQTVHVLPVKFNLFQSITGWRRIVRWLKVVSSPRLLSYLLLEAARLAPAKGKAIVATSSSLQDKIVASYPASGAAITVITPGVNRLPGLAVASDRVAARRALGLPVDGKCLLLVGNDYRKKGLGAALQALASLAPNVFLAVVGNAAQIEWFVPLTKQLGVENRVFFLGALDDVSVAYEAADTLLHPTLEDTFAMVVLEAMAHGLPVIVSSGRYCGISELLEQGVHGHILQDPRDHSAIARVVSELLEDPARYQVLSESCLLFAKQFAWTAIAQHQEQLYISVRAMR